MDSATRSDRETRRILGRGQGKLILLGEHAVVYGQPAIAAAISQGASASVAPSRGERNTLTLVDGKSGRTYSSVHSEDPDNRLARSFRAILDAFPQVTVYLTVRVTVDVPIGAGLGSSAAIAAAVARAIALSFGLAEDGPEVHRALAASEAVFHDRPSGIDQAVVLKGGVILYRRDVREVELRTLEIPDLTVAICISGQTSSTAEMVNAVADLHEREPVAGFVDALIGEVAWAGVEALKEGEFQRFGELMNINHGALVSLGVSTPLLDKICYIARDAGAWGAKLTGAGGGGCAIAIGPNPEDIVKAWEEQGYQGFLVHLS